MKNKGLVLLCLVFAFGCKKNAVDSGTDIEETAQQIGDAMASMDESGGSSGTLAQQTFEDSIKKTFDRYAPADGAINKSALAAMMITKAEATSCYGAGFGSCSGTTRIRTFSNCTVGAATLSGDVTLRWAGASATTCAYGGAGDSITRNPNFILTGRRGATLAVTKANSGGYGQGLTLATALPVNSTSIFVFGSDGINRKFTNGSGTVLYDQTTSTSGTLTVTGNSRSNRVINPTGAGSLKVVNNLTAVTCSYTPTNVTWNSAACNCPTQGDWAGSCSDGKTTSLHITGCGLATYTEGSDSVDLTFDRCASN